MAVTSGRAESMKLTTSPTIGSGMTPRLSDVFWWAAARVNTSSRSLASWLPEAALTSSTM